MDDWWAAIVELRQILLSQVVPALHLPLVESVVSWNKKL